MDFNYPVSQSWFAHYERTGRMLLQKCGVRINLDIYIYITIRQDLNFATLFNSPIHDFCLPIATRLTEFCFLHLEEQLITANCRLYQHSRQVFF
jgi:hypothetical protein